MRRAEDRPDPWSYSLRPVFGMILTTVAVGFCALLVFLWINRSRAHDILLPIDAPTGERAVFGIYVFNPGYERDDPKTGRMANGSVFNQTWPFGVTVSAWDDGRVAWSVGKRPEDGETTSTMVSPAAIAAARRQLIEAFDDATFPNEPPWVTTGQVRIHLFVRDGDQQRTIRAEPWQVTREAPDPHSAAGDMSELEPFRAKWAMLEAIMSELIPKSAERQTTEWLTFEQERH